MTAKTGHEVVARNKRKDRSWFIVMNGVGIKRDEMVGKGETVIGNTPPKASYMCDWRLT